MQDLADGFKDIVRVILKQKPDATLEEVKQHFFTMEPNFEKDWIFSSMIEDIYVIALCDIKIVKNEKPKEMPQILIEAYKGIITTKLRKSPASIEEIKAFLLELNPALSEDEVFILNLPHIYYASVEVITKEQFK